MNYNKFANIYDSFMSDIEYEKWANFIESKLNLFPMANILELGCGTGNLTSYLARKYNVIALDNSQQMLNIAFSKLYSKKNVKTINSDIRNFEFEKEFDAIISVCDSFNYIEPESLKDSFENVYSHLKNNGAFLFDLNSEYKLKTICGNNCFSDENEQALYYWQNILSESNSEIIFHIDFFVKADENLYERFTEQHTEYIYKTENIIELLEQTGFKNIEIYDDYNEKAADDKTERIVYIAQKE